MLDNLCEKQSEELANAVRYLADGKTINLWTTGLPQMREVVQSMPTLLEAYPRFKNQKPELRVVDFKLDNAQACFENMHQTVKVAKKKPSRDFREEHPNRINLLINPDLASSNPKIDIHQMGYIAKYSPSALILDASRTPDFEYLDLEVKSVLGDSHSSYSLTKK